MSSSALEASEGTFAGGILFARGQDGIVHALGAGSGRELWTYRTGGPMRPGHSGGQRPPVAARTSRAIARSRAADSRAR
jgi:hypothetical protein